VVASARTPEKLSVGQAAARSGVSVSALHFYEAEGLIESRRTAGNQRRYSRDVLRRIAFIRASQGVGIPLRQIKAALQLLPASRTPTRSDWERLSTAWRGDLDERISRLTQLRDKLTGCIGCGCLSLDLCELMNPDDILGREGPGPRNLTLPPENARGAGWRMPVIATGNQDRDSTCDGIDDASIVPGRAPNV
jgi:MerR family transcriptional regulator, redox-sensitive transcriptional activator SoxR